MITVKQNFLVFRGTRKEVDNAEVIDRCWYLAWDTGELFVGNSVGSKTKYGGNNQSMSKTEIIDYIESQFESYKDQFAEHNNIIHGMGEQINLYRNEFLALKTDTESYLKTEIDDILNDIDSLKITFVTQDQIKEYVTKLELDAYVKKDEVSESFIQPLHGEEIANRLDKPGFYLCISDYNFGTSTLLKGTIYQITHNQIIEISKPSTGGGTSVSNDPVIEFFTFNNITGSTTQFVPQNLNEIFGNPNAVEVQTQITNGSQFTSLNLQYKFQSEPAKTLKEISTKISNVQSILIDLESLIGLDKLQRPGKHSFIIYGITVSGKSISKQINYNLVRPIYYGSAGSNLMTTSILNREIDFDIQINIENAKLLNKADPKTNPSGEYEIEYTINKPYAWFCVPSGEYSDSMTITKVTPANSMADMPIMEIENIIPNYRCYRSVNGNIAHRSICKVEGTGNI